MDAFKIKPYRLINKIQHYAWGTKNDRAFIAQLLGLQPQPDLPYAELWMGTHPNAPSEVETARGRVPLNAFIQAFPREILGERVVKQFGARLPFLFKVLSAAEALSIQAHPNKEQAVALHRRDPQHYPDDNHKPEIAIALDHLTALVGFCSAQEITDMLIAYPEIADFVGQNLVREFEQSSADKRPSVFKRLFSALIKKGADNIRELETVLMRLQKRLQEKKVRNEKEVLFLQLRQKYHTDIGLLVIFFLNLLRLNKGQGVFLKAGLPHAYVSGNIVECMANSDNVVRAGLTPKFKDVKTLTDILDYHLGPVHIYKANEQSQAFVYRVPVPEFAIRRLKLSEGLLLQHRLTSIEICIIIKGEVTVACEGQALTFKQGDSVLFPAALQHLVINALTPAEIFCAFIPE